MKQTYEGFHHGMWLKKMADEWRLSCNSLAGIWGLKFRTACSTLKRTEVEIVKIQRLSSYLGVDLMAELLSEETKAEIRNMREEKAKLQESLEASRREVDALREELAAEKKLRASEEG